MGVVEEFQVKVEEDDVNLEYGAAKLRKRLKPGQRKNP